jgi:hypothetical protein
MSANPKRTIVKLERILNAWNTLAPEGKFGGMDKQQFETFVAASRAARAAIQNLEHQLREAAALREVNDQTALSKAQLVKNGVLADPVNGENSALYEAMGYIRKADRKSGLTRKKYLADKQD